MALSRCVNHLKKLEAPSRFIDRTIAITSNGTATWSSRKAADVDGNDKVYQRWE